MNYDVAIVSDKKPTLEEAQEFVGGLVEVVELNGQIPAQMMVNEEGLLIGLEPNEIASMMAKRHIVGKALILYGNARWLD